MYRPRNSRLRVVSKPATLTDRLIVFGAAFLMTLIIVAMLWGFKQEPDSVQNTLSWSQTVLAPTPR